MSDNSTVYFRQCFKDEFGMAPSDYLKKIKPESGGYVSRFFHIVKPFLTATYYRLRQWTVRSAWVDHTVSLNGLYSPLRETVVGNRKKGLNCRQDKP